MVVVNEKFDSNEGILVESIDNGFLITNLSTGRKENLSSIDFISNLYKYESAFEKKFLEKLNLTSGVVNINHDAAEKLNAIIAFNRIDS